MTEQTNLLFNKTCIFNSGESLQHINLDDHLTCINLPNKHKQKAYLIGKGIILNDCSREIITLLEDTYNIMILNTLMTTKFIDINCMYLKTLSVSKNAYWIVDCIDMNEILKKHLHETGSKILECYFKGSCLKNTEIQENATQIRSHPIAIDELNRSPTNFNFELNRTFGRLSSLKMSSLKKKECYVKEELVWLLANKNRFYLPKSQFSKHGIDLDLYLDSYIKTKTKTLAIPSPNVLFYIKIHPYSHDDPTSVDITEAVKEYVSSLTSVCQSGGGSKKTVRVAKRNRNVLRVAGTRKQHVMYRGFPMRLDVLRAWERFGMI